jgi:hypothetical protein
MLKRVLAAALAAGLVIALAPPAVAGSEIRLAQAAPSKPLMPQQQKMKDCVGKWQDEKAKKGQDRGEGPHRPSEIHGRLSEKSPGVRRRRSLRPVKTARA